MNRVGTGKTLWCAALAGLLLACQAQAVDIPDGGGSAIEPITNGNSATSGAYPWIVALVGKDTSVVLADRQFCGGTLVAPSWVLTAAHCVAGRTAGTFDVVIGRQDLGGSDGEGRQVTDIVRDPRYDAVAITHDAALLRLDRPSTITPATLIAADPESDFAGASVTAVGWGSTTGVGSYDCKVVLPAGSALQDGDVGCETVAFRRQESVAVLREGQLNVQTNRACHDHFLAYLAQQDRVPPADLDPDKPLVNGTLCVYDGVGTVAACFGDSGSPLVLARGGTRYVLGVASFVIADHCRGTHAVQFYTDIARVRGFIDDTLASTVALGFDHLCPTTGVPAATVGPVTAGKAAVRFAWPAADSAIGYTLLYKAIPRPGAAIGRKDLAAGVTELALDLPSGSHYYVSLQARGKYCDGKVTTPVEISVP